MMRTRLVAFPLLALALALTIPTAAPAQDLREAFRKAEQEREAVRARAAEREQAILSDRTRLLAAVDSLEAARIRLEAELKASQARVAAATARREQLEKQWATRELDTREISGNVRLAARDLEAMLQQSYFSVLDTTRTAQVSPLLDQGYYPGIDDISKMAAVMLTEFDLNGRVALHQGDFIGRDGERATGTIMTLGPFTAAYELPNEAGFLNWTPGAQTFFATSELPGGSVGRNLGSYLKGESDLVPIDLSGGDAVRQIAYKISFLEQFETGGPVVWPILGVAIVALFLVITRAWHLNRIHANTDHFMNEFNTMAARGDWAAADDMVARHAKRHMPVIEVIKAGLAVRDRDRETQESVLQEAILHQLPSIERGLSVLAVLGAVAPLLGLLGTVTGMINTFRVITLFGTSDPKLMSGGISEALVTTEFGLIVAIPVMLLHTLLSRRSDHIIGEMEEKAVQLTNILQARREDELAARAAQNRPGNGGGGRAMAAAGGA
jgi:biopolymer transport protein ExbB